jgi:hypothetical protein
LARRRRYAPPGAEPAAPARPPAAPLARGTWSRERSPPGCNVGGVVGVGTRAGRPEVGRPSAGGRSPSPRRSGRGNHEYRRPHGRNPPTCSTGPLTSSATRTKPAHLFDRSPDFVRHTDETRPRVRQVPRLRPPHGRNPPTCTTRPPTSSTARPAERYSDRAAAGPSRGARPAVTEAGSSRKIAESGRRAATEAPPVEQVPPSVAAGRPRRPPDREASRSGRIGPYPPSTLQT